MARLYLYLDPPFPSSTKKQNKNEVKVGPPLTKLSGSAHESTDQTWRLYWFALVFAGDIGHFICLDQITQKYSVNTKV